MQPTDPNRTDAASGYTVARTAGLHGELALVERDGEFEIISNGVFLMDSRERGSERTLVQEAIAPASGRRGLRMLMGGLGLGLSLAEALRRPELAEVVVVECEPAVVAWHRTHLGEVTGHALDDPRVRCEVADLVAWLQSPPTEVFDAVCLDVDNGPDWVVGPGNRWLYGGEGLDAVEGRLTDAGVLTVWSAHRAPAFLAALQARFEEVDEVEVPVPRGEPDVVYVARQPVRRDDVRG